MSIDLEGEYTLRYMVPVDVVMVDGEVTRVIVIDEEVRADPAMIGDELDPAELAYFQHADNADWPAWEFGY